MGNALTQLDGAGDPLEIGFCCEGYAVGAIGNVLFSTTATTPPTTAYDAADALSERLLRRYPEGICHLIIAAEGLPMPSAERRARIAASTRRFDGKILAIAMVFGGGGLWSSSMRMVGNAMMMVIPSQSERRMFGDVSQAVTWLTELFPRQLRAYSTQLGQLDRWLQNCPSPCPCPRGRSRRT